MNDGMEGLADAPESAKGKRPLTEENTPEDSGETLRVPMEFLQGKKFKEGDELVLKVIAMDEEGLEVAYAKPSSDSESGVNDELDSMDAQGGGEGY